MIPTKFQTALRLADPLAVEVKADAQGAIEGYASTIGGVPDRHGDVVAAGAFARTLAEHRAQGTFPALLWAHQLEEPIGSWRHIEEDATGLFVRGSLNLRTTKGREAFEHVRAGDAGALSIGYVVPEGGRRYDGGGVFTLTDVDLVEVSVVTVPANPRARITASKHIESKADAIEFLRAGGLSRKAAARFASGGYRALVDDETADQAAQLASRIDAATNRLRSL